MLVGIEYGEPGGSVVIVIAAVNGSSSILPRTTTQSHAGWLFFVFARSNGPAFAGTSNVRPNGAQPAVTDRAATAAVVGAGEIELPAGDRERLVADTNTDRRFADLAVFPAQPFIRARFGAQFDTRQHTRQARRQLRHDRLQVLFAVFTVHRHRQRRERTRLDVRRTRVHSRVERQARTRTRATARTVIDLEGRFRGDRTVAVPRREHRRRRVRPAARGCRQRCAFAAEEVQFEVFEREIGRVLERRDDLPRLRFSGTSPVSLIGSPRSGLRRSCTSRPGSRTGSRPATPDTPSLPVRVPTTVS